MQGRQLGARTRMYIYKHLLLWSLAFPPPQQQHPTELVLQWHTQRDPLPEFPLLYFRK